MARTALYGFMGKSNLCCCASMEVEQLASRKFATTPPREDIVRLKPGGVITCVEIKVSV
jgi:hypothetical protein